MSFIKNGTELISQKIADALASGNRTVTLTGNRFSLQLEPAKNLTKLFFHGKSPLVFSFRILDFCRIGMHSVTFRLYELSAVCDG